jgi:asparagine synthetase B (glutamine-hydrolysing)
MAQELRDLVEIIPPSERVLSAYASDHLLAFRSVPAGVAVLGPITRMRVFDCASVSVVQAQLTVVCRPIRIAPRFRNTQEIIEELDAVLAAECNKAVAVSDDSPTVLLTGGVDSTLLGTYLVPLGATAVIGQPEFEQYDPEVEYAKDAARLLRVALRVERVARSEMARQLADLTDATLMPIGHSQSLVVGKVMQRGGSYVTGDRADALFGNPPALPPSRLRGVPAHLLRLPVLGRVIRTVPSGRVAGRVLDAMSLPVTHVEGWAARFNRYADYSLLAVLMGKGRIEQLVADRLSWVQSVLPDEAEREDHIAVGQFGGYLLGDFPAQWTAIAHAHGASMPSPFLSRAMLELAHSIPLERRYFQNGVLKPHPKSLLSARLPGFDANAPKLSSVLPLTSLTAVMRQAVPTVMEAGEHLLAELPPDISDNDRGELLWAWVVRAEWQRAVRQASFRPIEPA